MTNEQARRDDNWQPVVQGETDNDARETRSLKVDPITKRLKTTTTVTDSVLPDGAATEDKQDDIIVAIEDIYIDDVFKDYGLYAWEDDATNFYVLNENKDGKWIMKRINDTTGVTTYSIGDDDAQQAWIDRATQTFTSYSDTF